MKEKRNISIDCIRIIAFLCVIILHFYIRNGLYNHYMYGIRSFFLILLASIVKICIPLYILLTGFLMCKKELTCTYYRGIIKTIIIYLLACILGLLYRVLVEHEGISLNNAISEILSFSAVEYSWYIEMYIGLFVMIPFLNILYNSLQSRHVKIWMILTSLCLTSLPCIVNVYECTSLQWWVMPSVSDNYTQLIPDWWVGFYPITIYFIGCYLREYALKISFRKNVVYLLASFLFSGVYCYYRSYGNWYVWGEWQSEGSLLNIIPAVLMFNLWNNLQTDQWPQIIRKSLMRLSELCLGAYLFSGIAERIVYPKLVNWGNSILEKVVRGVVSIVGVIMISLAASFVINMIYTILKNIYHKTIRS